MTARHGQYGIPDRAPSNSLDTQTMLTVPLHSATKKYAVGPHRGSSTMRDAHETLECGLGSVLSLVAVDSPWSLNPLLQDVSCLSLAGDDANNFHAKILRPI